MMSLSHFRVQPSSLFNALSVKSRVYHHRTHLHLISHRDYCPSSNFFSKTWGTNSIIYPSISKGHPRNFSNNLLFSQGQNWRQKLQSILTHRRWNSDKSNATKNVTAQKVNSNGSSSSSNGSANIEHTTFLQRFLGPKPMPPRNTPKWYAEIALICTVFGITGSSTMFLVRPAVSNVLGLEGSMKDGELNEQ